MLSESDRRILTRACGLCWHVENPYVKTENGTYLFSPYCKECGEVIYKDGWYYGGLIDNFHHDFSTPDDWELVRVKVVQGYRGAFGEFIVSDCIKDDGITAIRWWLTQSPEELCRHAVNFIKAHSDLFPWVVEREEERR